MSNILSSLQMGRKGGGLVFIAGLIMSLAVPRMAGATIVIGSDDFDGGGVFLSRDIAPDNSGNSPPGTFNSSQFDVFGIIDRNVNRLYQDDTISQVDNGSTGMVTHLKTDSFFGVTDFGTGHPSGPGTIVYEFDISGKVDLGFSVALAAYADFELDDTFVFDASIDGGPTQTLISITADESATQTYTFDDGSTQALFDPLSVNGTLLDNSFQTFSQPITGTGSTLTLTFTVNQVGGELFGFDNITISAAAVPEPSAFFFGGLVCSVLGVNYVRRRWSPSFSVLRR